MLIACQLTILPVPVPAVLSILRDLVGDLTSPFVISISKYELADQLFCSRTRAPHALPVTEMFQLLRFVPLYDLQD